MIKIFLVKLKYESSNKFDSVGPKLRTVKFCFPEYLHDSSLTPRSSLLMLSSSLVIREHLISIAEIIHSVNDLGVEYIKYINKTDSLGESVLCS